VALDAYAAFGVRLIFGLSCFFLFISRMLRGGEGICYRCLFSGGLCTMEIERGVG
jgi:hypothetical protein